MNKYYVNQLTNYNDNYDDAISKLNSIINKLDVLYRAFNGAAGADVELIRKDLQNLGDQLEATRKKIVNSKEKTNTNATNSDITYEKALQQEGLKTPVPSSSLYYFENYTSRHIYIDEGIIYAVERFKKIPIAHQESILSGIIKAFNNYPTVISTVKADVENMMKGELLWVGDFKKSYETMDDTDNLEGSGGGSYF